LNGIERNCVLRAIANALVAAKCGRVALFPFIDDAVATGLQVSTFVMRIGLGALHALTIEATERVEFGILALFPWVNNTIATASNFGREAAVDS